jgi:fructoselysine-6-P-deglycase FrlB-like protein
MSDETKPHDSAAMSPASAGSHGVVVAWAVVNPSGGTRFLGLTNEDARRVATASERVVPVCWPALTDAERIAIKTVIVYLKEDDDFPGIAEDKAALLALLERTK